MTRIDALKALLGKVEAGEVEISDFHPAFSYGLTQERVWAREAYTGSLDAAKALHEAVLTGWWVQHIGKNLKGWGVRLETNDGEFTDNVLLPRYECPARAWLIAILKALISIEESKE